MPLIYVLLILGIVQGIAEFLPVSSSGHLVILNQIFSSELTIAQENINLLINVSLHCATLIAVVIYLSPYLYKLIKGVFRSLKERTFSSPEIKTALNICIASIPAGVIGILFHDFFTSIFTSINSALVMLIINGFVLIFTKKIPQKGRKIEEIGLFRSCIIGFFQAFAIMPGISRSGMTIAGGMFAGLEPLEAARFSFLMAIPVVGGAGLLEGTKVFQETFPTELAVPLIVSMVVTVLIALVSLRILFALVKRVRIDIFGYYTITLGIGGLIFINLVP